MSLDLAVALQTARVAAQAAGQVLARKFRQTRAVQSKGWRNIVTDADFAAERAVLEVIRTAHPTHLILSEEGQHDVDLLGDTPVWIVDPLDGTTNYARQFPNFSVAIALAQGGALQVGVIADPLRQQAFYAVRGQGAFGQSKAGRPRPLRVAPTPDLATAIIGLDWARETETRAQALAALNRVAPTCRTVRAVGSTALGLAFVSAGWLDAYYHLAMQVWDVAPGVLLIQEAGGRVTTLTGADWTLTTPHIVASNGLLHNEFLRQVAGE